MVLVDALIFFLCFRSVVLYVLCVRNCPFACYVYYVCYECIKKDIMVMAKHRIGRKGRYMEMAKNKVNCQKGIVPVI